MRTSILRNLRSGGKRLTKPRRAILDLLEKSALPVTAVEIHQGLKKAKVSADLVTVYRNLTMLQNLGWSSPSVCTKVRPVTRSLRDGSIITTSNVEAAG